MLKENIGPTSEPLGPTSSEISVPVTSRRAVDVYRGVAAISCLRCGNEILILHCQPDWLVTAALEAFDKYHEQCWQGVMVE